MSTSYLFTLTLCQVREMLLESGTQRQGPELGRQPTKCRKREDQTGVGENEQGSARPGWSWGWY